ncbi:MAG TPA: endonuclease/exonuclease/phosphatase family protein [Longimicrobiales bacterium]|nr:endonuclease/exonuclease/phosphatase family protein [Longimicrobiales bacterium]
MTKRSWLLLTAGVLCACSDIPTALHEDSASSAVGPTVMTRNIYLGADLNPVLNVSSPQQIPVAAAGVWAMVQATNFPARAVALADEIARERPHLIGLQEVALYQLQSPGDAAFGGGVAASDVAYDYLAILLDALGARGLDYVPVAVTTNTTIEVPVYTGQAPIPFDDVRFTMRDVILARADVSTSNPAGASYTARLNIPIGGAGGPPVSLRRGWASIDANVAGRAFRFFTTHLEVQVFAPLQQAQASELIGLVNASSLPVIVVGDFNSAADGSQTPTYGMLTGAGLEDRWSKDGDPGYTCCHAHDLTNTTPTLDQRLDIIFTRGFGAVVGQPKMVGDKVDDLQRYGLWPSDHAGVVAQLRLPPGHNR